MTREVFIDLRKAFDSEPHNAHALNAKLKRFGIKDNSLNRFSNYLFNRTQAVSIGNTLSNHSTIQSGLPQGRARDHPRRPIIYVIH